MAAYLNFARLDLRDLNSSAAYTDDNSFGPFVNLPGKVTFDFTLLFEETILSIGPSVLLLILIPLRILYLWKSPRKVISNYLLTTKTVLLAIFSILQIVNVVETCQSSFQTRASLAAAVLSLVATLGLCILSYYEHTKTIRPSSIINAYLFLTLSFDAAQLRTRWLRGDNLVGNGIYSSILALKLLVLISEATEKTGILFTPYSHLSPEATSGLFSRGLFWWLHPLFHLGYRGIVNDDDLFAADGELLSEACEIRFAKYWSNRARYPKNHTLVWVMSRVLLGPFSAAVLPRLALTFFRFMQPLLIKRIIQLVREPVTEATINNGWGLIAAAGLVYVGLAVAGGAHQHKTNRVATMVRGSLVCAIYSQTLDLPVASLNESAAVTLMSADIERICVALLPIHTIWSAPIEIALAIWLLQKEIGIALLGPLFITAIAVSGPFLIAKHMGAAQKAWLESIQKRIDTTAKMLPAMKGVKMLGFSSKISSIIDQLRLNEIVDSLKMRKLLIVMIAFGNFSSIFASVAAFIIYVIVASVNRQILDVSSAFTALSLIALLIAPIRSIVFTTPPLIAAIGCFDRIEAFITSSTKQDDRMIVRQLQGQSSSTTKPDTSSKGSISAGDVELEEIILKTSTSALPATISVKNLTLAWSKEDRPVINDVSFDIQPGDLTMIVGPVGSGKSSLLRGLLGETPISKGSVYIDRAHVALVVQFSWIQNCSVRENIIGIYPYEPQWYNKVIQACAIDTDIEAFPEGDSTSAGTAGAALSGGQKLRIALARAVYSRHRIIILDDVFSGLDAINEERIFSRLLAKNALLHKLGTTIILATHAAHRLSLADQIIVLSTEGTITEQGSYRDLMAIDGYVSSHVARHTSTANQDEDVSPTNTKPTTDTARQNAKADIYRPVGNWATYKFYLSSLGWRSVGLWAGLMFFYSLLQQFPSLWMKFWTDAIAIHGNSVNGLYLGVLIAIAIASLGTLMLLTGMLFTKMIPRSATFLHAKLLGTVENASLSFLTSTDSGQLLNRFSNDLSVIDSELPLAGLVLANNTFMTIIQAVLICISASYFASVVPFVLLVMYLLQKFYLRTSRQIRLMDLEAKAPLYSNFLETINGLTTIRAFGWAQEMSKRNMNLLDASQRPFYLLYCIQVWLVLVIDLLVAGLAVILVALIVTLRHKSNAGFVGLALLNIMSFNMTLSAVIINWTATETSLGAVSRIKSFVQTTLSENKPEEVQEVPSDWPSKGEIVLSDITASYALDQSPALQNFNLTITPGEKIGICGPSGAGKSSFVALLLHMLELNKGTINIDGIDLLKTPRNVLRERINTIPQEPIFIKGTILQNLDTASPTKAQEVLEKLGLWTLISNAGGLDVQMEAESLLSHGQRQIFCLARAMLRRSKIVIVDEATANVDVETEQVMQKVIEEHFVGCTVIAVAHRLDTIRGFDRVVVLEGGKVVECGEPDILLKEKGGKFKALWEA